MLEINKSMRKITYYENILEFKENTKEELHLNEVNNWKLCRTCLVDTDENCVNINNMNIMDTMRGTILNIKQMIAEITRIKISKTENIPLQVCNECFNKITELYYFNIQLRRAEKVLNRLAERFKNHKDVKEKCETNTNHQDVEEECEPNVEVKDYQDIGSMSDVASSSIDENETNPDEQEFKESLELFEQWESCEIAVFNSGVDSLSKDRKSPLSAEVENHVQITNSSCDEESNLENNLIEYLESCDTDSEEPPANSTVEANENVKFKLKEVVVRPNKKRVSAGTAGYRHKQPRVTSPLLDDFDCAICHISFGRQHDLVQHVRDSHPNSKAYKCRVCGNQFSHIQSLSRHMNSHKEAVVLNECEYCSKPFVRVDDLKRHLRVHTGERPYVCSICEKSFQQQSDLKCHQKKHYYEDTNQQPRIFECTQCNKAYASRTGLNWHKKTHHSQENYSQETLHYCLTCEKTVIIKSNVKCRPPAGPNKCAGCGKNLSSDHEGENEEEFTIIEEKD